MKKISTAFVLFLLPFSTALSAFVDLPQNHEFNTAVNYVQQQGIVQGYADGTYRPSQSINRAEFTKIIMSSQFNLAEIEACPGSSFSDVPSAAWFAPFVCLAKQKGIIAGYPDGTFKPEQLISFAEAAKILVQSFGYDSQEGTVWFEGFVKSLAARNAIPTQIQSFEHSISRGEMAEMVFRLKAEVNTKASLSYELLAGIPIVPEPTPEPVAPTPVIKEETVIVRASKYADGTYTQEGSYRSPGGRDIIDVTLTLESDVVVDVDVAVVQASGTSRGYIGRFSDGIAPLIVGKSIDDFDAPGRINGSSLTVKGFNTALTAIKAEAQN